MRAWFEARAFIEVEAAALQVSPGNEAHLHAFATEALGPDGARTSLYLHTSPEFAAKKLLAAGETRLFDFARVFRNRERGALHHPEFTLLEWYRAREPYQTLMDDCHAILELAADTAGADRFAFRGRACDPRAEPERLSVADAFERYASLDLLASLGEDGTPDRGALASAAQGVGVRVAADDTWADVFSRVLVEKVEPNLGIGRPTILYQYPTAEAALARRTPYDPRVAERFELYACGVELANAFGELTDPVEQRRRFEAEMDEKARVYGERYPLDEDLLDALAHMPPASGAALGFDRLADARHRRRTHRAGDLDARRPHVPPMTTTLRTPAALAEAGLIDSASLPVLERVAARYAVAVTPAMAELIDADDSADPIARQFLPQPFELDPSPGERADPIGDDAHTPVQGIVHRYPDRVLLKLTHTCAVYCRFCFRREVCRARRGGRPGRHGVGRRPGLYRCTSCDLGGGPDRRRSAGAVAAPARSGDGAAWAGSITSRSCVCTPASPPSRPSA